MNCYNGAEFLEQSINAVYAQSIKDWEIIFIDNASTDSSAEIVKKFDEKIRYFRLPKTVPLYEARNVAIQHVRGKFVAFLDVDDLWESDKLEKQIALMTDKISLVCTDVQYINENNQKLPKQHCPLKRGKVTQSLLLKNFIAISSVLIRTEIFKNNIFDPKYNLAGDYEFWLRISTKYEFDYVPEKLFLSRLHSRSTTNRSRGKWIIELRQMYLNFYKQFGFKYPNLFIYMVKAELFHFIGRY